MSKLKTIIVDDEVMALKAMQRLCQKTEKIQLLQSFDTSKEALDYLGQNEIDLLFLDVEMPGLSGLELLEQLDYHPQVIITSSNTEYAYDAFEYDVTDFLKKPVNLPRFMLSLEKVERELDQLQQLADQSSAKEIYIRSDGSLTRIPIETILYFENIGDYVKIITKEKNHIIQIGLKALHEKLNHPRLLKVHRSFIVNLDHVVDIRDNSMVIQSKVIPISRAHRSIVLNAINIIN